MIRLFALVAVLAATSAFATGEHIIITGSNTQLKDTLCLSMECGGGKTDATVSTREVKGGVEVTVTMANGQRKLTQVVSATEGVIGSTDLVHTTTLIQKAIEAPVAAAPEAKKVAAAPASKAGSKLPAGRAVAHR